MLFRSCKPDTIRFGLRLKLVGRDFPIRMCIFVSVSEKTHPLSHELRNGFKKRSGGLFFYECMGTDWEIEKELPMFV